MSPNYYSYRVTWSQEDNEHLGLYVKFPSFKLAAGNYRAFTVTYLSGDQKGNRAIWQTQCWRADMSKHFLVSTTLIWESAALPPQVDEATPTLQ